MSAARLDATDFVACVRRAKRAAYRSSNDVEVNLLQNAVSAACRLLGVNEEAIDDEVYASEVELEESFFATD